jgi:hypothetical protein
MRLRQVARTRCDEPAGERAFIEINQKPDVEVAKFQTAWHELVYRFDFNENLTPTVKSTR